MWVTSVKRIPAGATGLRSLHFFSARGSPLVDPLEPALGAGFLAPPPPSMRSDARAAITERAAPM